MVFTSGKHSSRSSGTHGPSFQDPPILTPALANTVADTVYATLGYALLAAVAISWAALVSWSASDPSFTRTGLDTARNLVGYPGAFGADLAYQTLGVAAFAVLLAPMFWSVAMIRGESDRNSVAALLAYVGGIAGLAAAAALWRSVPGWPMTHGLGGIAGENALTMMSAVLIAPLGELARPAVAAACGVAGASLTLIACGLPLPRLQAVEFRNPLTHAIEPQLSSPAPPVRVAAAVCDSDTRRWGPDPLEPIDPNTRAQSPHRWPPLQTRPQSDQRIPPQTSQQFGPYAGAALADRHLDSSDPDFDDWTEASSSGIAARFAYLDPASVNLPVAINGPRALQNVLSKALGFGADQTMNRAPGVRSTAAPDALAATWHRPSLNLLARPSSVRPTSANGHKLNRGNSSLICDALAEFGIDGTPRGIEPGPVVTTFLFEIARPTKLSRVIALASDIASFLKVPALRVSGRRGDVVAIELPNAEPAPVVLRDCLDSEAYRSELDVLPIALGLGSSGVPIVADLAQMTGLLVSGSEASARATGLNAMILSLIYRHGPDDCRFVLIDPRLVDLAVYDGIPHLLTPVVADPHKAITALAWCVREMDERIKRMSFLGVRSIELFNNRVRNAAKRGEVLQRKVQTGFDDRTGTARFETQDIDLSPMPYIVIVIEDIADLMAVAGREIEGAISRLAKAARAAGIHLIVATDRTTPDIVTPSIRDSLPARLSYRVAGRAESRSILGDVGAEHLLAGGDSLLSTGGAEPVRIHGPMVSADETASVAMSLKERGAPDYVAELSAPSFGAAQARSSASRRTHSAAHPHPSMRSLDLGLAADGHRTDTSRTAPGTMNRDDGPGYGDFNHRHPDVEYAVSETASPPRQADELYDRAVAVAVRDGGASIGHLQSTLRVSAGWAANLLARLEADAVVGPADVRGVHRILTHGRSQVA